MKSLDSIPVAQGEIESLETLIVGPALLKGYGLDKVNVGDQFTYQGRVHTLISKHSGINEHGRFFTFHFSSKGSPDVAPLPKARLTGIVMDGERLTYLGE